MDFFVQIMRNKPFWVAILAFATAQLIKISLSFLKFGQIKTKHLLASGGMPSSHSAFVMAMSMSIGKITGYDSPLFAACAVISFIVMYDAAGVRRSAGEQAVLVNMIVEKIEETGIVIDERLKEFLGHRPIEVGVGAVMGASFGIFL